MKNLYWILPATLFAACSDGQLGDQGLVRFSQVVNFAETSDFNSTIVVGKPIFIALQHPNGLNIDSDTFTELTLRIEDPSHPGETSSDAVIFPLGFAQYGAILNTAGPFRLVAEDKGIFLDGLVIHSEALSGIRFSFNAQVTTTTAQCTVTEDINGDPSGFLLHANQEIAVNIVPENATGDPMLGLLALTAESDSELSLDSPLFGQGVTPNQLIIRPSGQLLGFPASVNITEVESNATLSATLDTTNDDATVTCP